VGLPCAETGNRTQDTTIFSRVLYQLSYLGKLGYFNRMQVGCQAVFDITFSQGYNEGIKIRAGIFFRACLVRAFEEQP
jgi:hypothetical protein